MRSTIRPLAAYSLLTLLGSSCGPMSGSGGVNQPATARYLHFYNCTHVNGPTEPPSGRAFNMYSRVDGGPWVARGGLNPQPGPWTDCHDDAHEAASLTLDLAEQAGQWEVWAIELPRGDEPSCDSSAPDVPDACQHLAFSYHTDVSKGTVVLDVSDQ